MYLSYFFKSHRTEYYAKLTAIRTKGDWEGWVKFFLRGICETSQMANQAALEIHQLHETDLEKIKTNGASAIVMQVFTIFCKFPVATIPQLQKEISRANQVTLNRVVKSLVDFGILKQIGEGRRNRKFSYEKYIAILTRDTATAVG